MSMHTTKYDTSTSVHTASKLNVIVISEMLQSSINYHLPAEVPSTHVTYMNHKYMNEVDLDPP